MAETLAVTRHFIAPSLQVETCTTRGTMSFTKRGRNLPHALRAAYAGPKAAERLASDAGMSLRSARSALSGQYPRAWERFLDVIAKKPAILARALETSWAEELSVKAEIAATRRRLDEMERRLREKNQTVDRKAT